MVLKTAWQLGTWPARRILSNHVFPSRRVVGAVIEDNDRLLSWLPKGKRAAGWHLPRFYLGNKSEAKKDALARGLKQQLGLKNFEIVRRVARRRGADSVDWWLVKTPKDSWGSPLKTPKGVERLDWVKRDIICRYGPEDLGQKDILTEYQRMVVDSFQDRLPEKRILIDGLDLCYSELGDPNKPPLLLIHGLGSDLQIFRWNAREWAKHFHVFALDLPGHGRSAKPPIPYSLSFFQRVIRGFMKAKTLNKARVLGYSMGGLISTLFASNHPELVERLVLLAPAGYRSDKTPVKTIKRMARVLKNPLYPLVRDSLFKKRFHSFYHRFTPEMDLLFEEALAISKRRDYLGWLQAVGQSLESILRNPGNPAYGKVKAPTLILFGENDRIVPASCARKMAREIPNASVSLYPNCGHSLVVEQRDLVTDDVLSFLRREQS
ncbi:MAG: alpha/beta hydrolase [Planctomycetota bacterium]|nr:alpha/beta hydrolase [Planctomycetota bacterium]